MFFRKFKNVTNFKAAGGSSVKALKDRCIKGLVLSIVVMEVYGSFCRNFYWA